MEKKVSVIVPVYNAENYLKKCLDSICGQSYKWLEILLINDGSTDDSGQICREYARKDNRIAVINKPNGGSTSARKRGIMSATGKYLCFVDSDDWIEKDMIEMLVTVAEKNQVDLVVSDFIYEYEDTKTQKAGGGTLEAGVYAGNNYANIFIQRMFYGGPANGWGIWPTLWGKLFETAKFKPYVLELNEEIFYGEDAASLYPFCLSAGSGAVIKEKLYHYRIRENSVSVIKNPHIFDNLCILYNYLYESFSKSVQREILLQNLKYYLLVLFNHAVNMQTCFNGNIESLLWEKPKDLRKLVLPEYKKDEENTKDEEKIMDEEKYTWTSIWLFPFNKIPENATFVVFGAGYVGKSFAWQLKRSRFEKQWLAWIDTADMCKKESGLKLSCIDEIKQLNYDYVVLAAANQEVAEKMKLVLLEKDVPREKIIWQYPEQLRGILIKREEN